MSFLEKLQSVTAEAERKQAEQEAVKEKVDRDAWEEKKAVAVEQGTRLARDLKEEMLKVAQKGERTLHRTFWGPWDLHNVMARQIQNVLEQDGLNVVTTPAMAKIHPDADHESQCVHIRITW